VVREKRHNTYAMAGRLRSSRMNEQVLEEGLREGVDELRGEMKGLLWKIERSRDMSHEGMKGIVWKGFESMGKVVENIIRRVGDRLVDEVRRRDRGERELEERICMLEETKVVKERTQVNEERKREERIQMLEQRQKERGDDKEKYEERLRQFERRLIEKEEESGVLKANLAALELRVNALLKGKEDMEKQDRQQQEEWLEKERATEERMRVLEEKLKEWEMKRNEVGERQDGDEHEEERMGELAEFGKVTGGDRDEQEKSFAAKVRQIEKGLEKERNERMKWEEEKREEREKRERIDSIKEMELKVNDSMENLKILNLKFKKVSQVKAELLKEAEGIIKGKVLDMDRKECEWILRRSRVYILGKGTVEKELGKEKICTAPLLVKCGSQVERERLEGMLRRVGLRSAFHWPREMLEFVDEMRGWVEGKGYRKDEYFIKVRPYKVEGILQLRAEVKRKDGKGGGFRRAGSWSCPPLDRNLW